MIQQHTLSIQYKSAKKHQDELTQLSGLLWYADLIEASGVFKDLPKARPNAWSQEACAMTIVYMQLAGCDSIEDVDSLREDAGWQQLWVGKSLSKQGPSKSTLHRSLMKLDEGALMEGNMALMAYAQRLHPQSVATLDQDATIVPSQQRCAQWTYKELKGFQPSQVSWAEQRMVVHSEYRKGSHPASKGILEQLKASVSILPSGVEEIRYRGDAASYQEDVLTFCQERHIGFSISGKLSKPIREEARLFREVDWTAFKDKDGVLTDEQWVALHDKPEWADKYRYILIRRPLSSQAELDIEYMDPKQVVIKGQRYRLSLIVTNRNLEVEELIQWHRERCGYGEAIHKEVKHDCAGHWTPSKHFEANAVWWTLAVITHNLHELMKQLLPGKRTRRLKAIRLAFIHAPGRIIRHARRLIIRVAKGHYELMSAVSLGLSHGPPIG